MRRKRFLSMCIWSALACGACSKPPETQTPNERWEPVDDPSFFPGRWQIASNDLDRDSFPDERWITSFDVYGIEDSRSGGNPKVLKGVFSIGDSTGGKTSLPGFNSITFLSGELTLGAGEVVKFLCERQSVQGKKRLRLSQPGKKGYMIFDFESPETEPR